MKKVRIGGSLIGQGEPCFIIAEAGVNHNGELELAKKLVDAAKKAGADAVKFQAFKTERVATRYAEKADYQKVTTGSAQSQYDMIKSLELTERELRELHEHARSAGILFLSSAFDEESVDLLGDLGVEAFKVGSGEITNFPLLQHIALKKKPVILSTGMSTLGEIDEAIAFIRRTGIEDIVLLHCITGYPSRPEDSNLRVMKTLEQAFDLPVGFSDHTLGTAVSLAAVALGAKMIEKHFTLDRALPGPDHKASLEPRELKDLISGIRAVEKSLGGPVRKPTRDEEQIKRVARRSLVARVRIPKGTIIKEGMLDAKRPGSGIEPKRIGEVVGKVAKKTFEPDELISFRDLM